MTIRTIVRVLFAVSVVGLMACDNQMKIGPTPPTYTVSGVVSTLTPTGSVPLAGVVVTDTRTQHIERTDDNGFYRLSILGPPLGTTISMKKSGYITRKTTHTFNSDTRLDIQLDVRESYTLSGVISEATPTGLMPIEGVIVDEISYEDRVGGDYENASVTTDANGRYSISGVWAGSGTARAIWLTKAGYRIDYQQSPPCDNCYMTFDITADKRIDIQLERMVPASGVATTKQSSMRR